MARFFLHRPRFFIARSVQKPQANTFSYRPHTRLTSNQHESHYNHKNNTILNLLLIIFLKLM